MTTDVGNIRPVKIEDEMRGSYLDYAMSVIVSRALPDVRDGLKPVHRRILYAMEDMGVRAGTAYKKSARIVGEVLGKYHPHGDAPVYDSMVRMAQTFSMRYPLIDGQGNFGSVDNDPPAAMRYTEARLAAIAQEMLADIDRDTVDFTPNFDGSMNEPSVLPARIPNLLLNGSSGIAVGMATNIPPHNLNEVCDAVVHLIDNPDATSEDLMRFVKGPDFPTAGLIIGRDGIRNAYTTGHGRIVLRARAFIEEARGNRKQIIVTELPFQISKAALVEKIADLVKDKKLDGISDLRDESDRHGMRIVIELKREADPNKVRNNLYKHTAMQTAFFANMLALVGGQPRVLTLKAALSNFINFRREIITRRSRYDLAKAREREHILLGLKTALDNLDAVISTIRRSQNAETARTNLMRGFSLSQVQAQAILDMQLRRLAALERKKIEDELAEVIKTIAYLEDLLANPKKIDFLIKEESGELKKTYGDARRTQITEQENPDFTVEDLIPHQEVAVTLSRRGYIKRLPSNTYRLQSRGGRGVMGMGIRDTDAVRHLLVVDTHSNLLFFTRRGRVFQAKAHEVPEDSRTTRGLPLINLVSIEPNEVISTVMAISKFDQGGDFMLMATRRGEVKKTPLSEFAAVRSNGLIAWPMAEDDDLISARLARDTDEVLLVTRKGQAIRFSAGPLRAASRTSGGVRGIRLGKDDEVVAMEVVRPKAFLLTVTANGFGKRTRVEEYPTHNRGGGGVISHILTEKTGDVAGALVVSPKQELMIITANGIVIRTTLEEISAQGRNSRGVTVQNVGAGDSVVDIALANGGEAEADAPRKPRSASPDALRNDGKTADGKGSPKA